MESKKMRQKAESKRVGVVIPVYNTPIHFLRECVESVLKQTYRHLEICLVNDGSTDTNCLDTLKDFCKVDSRVVLIHKAYNSGVSEARNVGIEWFSRGGYGNYFKAKEGLHTLHIQGENPYEIAAIYSIRESFMQRVDYIIFLDSDDAWRESLVETCLKYARGVDVVWFNHLNVYEFAQKHSAPKVQGELELLEKESIISGEDWIKHVKAKGTIETSLSFVWRMLIDFKFLQDIQLRFVHQCFMEDNLFSALLFYQARKIYRLPQKLMLYRVREYSLTNYKNAMDVSIPPFLEILCEKFYGNRFLTRQVWIGMSCHIMNLHLQDFLNVHKGSYEIATLGAEMTKLFRDYYLSFLHREIDLDGEEFLRICFNVFLYLARNYKAFRPFDGIEESFLSSGFKHQEVLRLMSEMVFVEQSIIAEKNATIKTLHNKIKALEEENSALYLAGLTKQTNPLKIFR